MMTKINKKNSIVVNMKVLPVYYPLLVDDSRFLILYGGAGSGKSYFAAQKILMRVMQEPGHKILCLRKHASNLRKSIYANINNIIKKLHLEDFFEKRVSPPSFTFYNGSQIIFAGLDDPEKIKSISGITSIWMEECTEFNLEDFQQLNLRLREPTPDYHQIILTFNPVSKSNWVYKTFFEKEYEGAKILKTTYKDNKNLPPNYINSVNSLKDQNYNYYKIYALGEWGSLSKNIYKTPQLYTLPPTKIDKVIYGIDFGFNNPTAIIRVIVSDKKYYIEEVLYEQNLTNSELIKKFPQLGIGKLQKIYADCAEPARIKEIKSAGYYIREADKNVIDGIDKIRSLWDNIYINENSTNLIDEINSYSYQKNSDGEYIEKPVKIFDHLVDAMRYALYTDNKSKSTVMI